MAAPSSPPPPTTSSGASRITGGTRPALASGALTAHHIHGTQWSVLVHPKADDYDDRLVARLRRHEGPRVVNIVCRMTVVGRDGKDSDQAATVAWNKAEKGASGGDVVLASRWVIFGNKGRYLPSGTLTIRVKLWSRPEQDGPPTSETTLHLKKCLTWTVLDKSREAKVLFSTLAQPEMFDMSFTPKIEMTYPHRRNNPDVTLSTNVNVADDIFYDSTLFARSQNDENRDDGRRKNFNARYPPNTLAGIDLRGRSHLYPGLEEQGNYGSQRQPEVPSPLHREARWLYGRDTPEFIDSSKLESQSELKFHCDFLVFDGSMNHCVASPCYTRSNTDAALLNSVLELTSRACTGTRTTLTWT
ncbi:hypothetical protein JTE90_004841 [Oedothorax gibbosus]|uniref:Uncharacterized protein n=1 Tax=Oedothorax gibbosus TaxID=931172 RepID=A0AAV6URP3_9ARAC|nr:hypothetical protein JTE90_004841 [Oedothorax gibbosus]